MKRKKNSDGAALLQGVRCFAFNFTVLQHWHNAVHAARDCGFDARDLAITTPSARQKRQETAVSPACALFRFLRLADATG